MGHTFHFRYSILLDPVWSADSAVYNDLSHCADCVWVMFSYGLSRTCLCVSCLRPSVQPLATMPGKVTVAALGRSARSAPSSNNWWDQTSDTWQPVISNISISNLPTMSSTSQRGGVATGNEIITVQIAVKQYYFFMCCSCMLNVTMKMLDVD